MVDTQSPAYKKDQDLKVQLLAYSHTQGIVQLRINGSVYEYTIQGNVEAVVEQMKHQLSFGSPASALAILRAFKVPDSKARVDILDILELAHLPREQVKYLSPDPNFDH